MEIYVLVCINIFPPFYCLCITSMSHHPPTMNFTWITPKPFKNKNLPSFVFGANDLASFFVFINLHRKSKLFCLPSMKSLKRYHGMTAISSLLYNPCPLVTWSSHRILDFWTGPRGGSYTIAFKACNKSLSLEGMKGVSSIISRIPPSWKITSYFGPPITKFEP